MKTHSTFARLCLASLPAFVLTLSAAENERRENPDRQPEQRESRREPRPETQAAPREGQPGEARPQSAPVRRPGGELSRELSNRASSPSPRDASRGNPPAPQAQRSGNTPRAEGGSHPPMTGQRDGGNPQEREQHIHQAIEHLRMAGLNDLAGELQKNISGGNNPGGPGQMPQAGRERNAGPGGNHPGLQPPGGAGMPGRNFTPPMAGGGPGGNVHPPMAGGARGRDSQSPMGGGPPDHNVQRPVGGGSSGHSVQPPMAGGSSSELRELHEQVGQLKKMVEELARQRR
ncbi:MAG: hypothetical protein HY301_20585 [Verrucomicrobia bacterium]|nr:hypothetical protein [Verrucomicrobiota bacterium]